MADAITNVPYSYYNVLNPTSTAAPAAPPAAPDTTSSPTDTTSTQTPTAVPTTSGALSTPALSSSVAALLQEFGSTASSIGGLLGSGGNSDGTESLLEGNAYTSLLNAAYQSAPPPAPGQSTPTPDPLQNILSTYQSAINAYSTPSDAQSVISAKSYQADGKTP